MTWTGWPGPPSASRPPTRSGPARRRSWSRWAPSRCSSPKNSGAFTTPPWRAQPTIWSRWSCRPGTCCGRRAWQIRPGCSARCCPPLSTTGSRSVPPRLPARARLPRPVVLVPTMGALHSGHRALLRRARELSSPDGSLMVSIFVNPLQFGPGEDFDRYPRSLEQDLAICAEEGADVLFAPDQAEIYPGEQLVRVDPGQMGQVLEGRSRPGFLPGMLTVVMKLFQLTAPDVAVFG